MALYEQIKLTRKGKSLLDRVFLGVELRFTRIALSSAYHEGVEIEALTSIEQSFSVSSFDYADIDHLNIRAAGNNLTLKSGYYVKSLGVYANDPLFGEILIGYTNANPADYIPAWNKQIGVTDFEISIAFAIRDCDTVNVIVEEETWATQKALNNAIKERPVRYLLPYLPQVFNADYYLDLICTDKDDAIKKIEDLKSVDSIELLAGGQGPFSIWAEDEESTIANAKEHSSDIQHEAEIAIVL